MSSPEDLKAKGNAAFSAGNYEEAIEHFTNAIEVDPSNHVFYSNRSAALSSLKRYHQALEDANKVVELKQDWPKGYSRKGAALEGLGKLPEAMAAYREGLKVDPNNAALQSAAQALGQRLQAGQGNLFDQLGPMLAGLNDPGLMTKLALNPATAPFLNQPDFVEKLKEVQANPQAITKHMGDQRIMAVFQMVMQESLAKFRPKGGQGGEEHEEGEEGEEEEDVNLEEAEGMVEAEREEAEVSKKEAPKKEEPKKEEDEEMDDEAKKAKQAHDKAQALKAEGDPNSASDARLLINTEADKGTMQVARDVVKNLLDYNNKKLASVLQGKTLGVLKVFFTNGNVVYITAVSGDEKPKPPNDQESQKAVNKTALAGFPETLPENVRFSLVWGEEALPDGARVRTHLSTKQREEWAKAFLQRIENRVKSLRKKDVAKLSQDELGELRKDVEAALADLRGLPGEDFNLQHTDPLTLVCGNETWTITHGCCMTYAQLKQWLHDRPHDQGQPDFDFIVATYFLEACFPGSMADMFADMPVLLSWSPGELQAREMLLLAMGLNVLGLKLELVELSQDVRNHGRFQESQTAQSTQERHEANKAIVNEVLGRAGIPQELLSTAVVALGLNQIDPGGLLRVSVQCAEDSALAELRKLRGERPNDDIQRAEWTSLTIPKREGADIGVLEVKPLCPWCAIGFRPRFAAIAFNPVE